MATFTDANGKILHVTPLVQHGVDGEGMGWLGKPSDRWVTDSLDVDPQIGQNTDRIDVWIGMAPRNRLAEDLGITIEDIASFIVWLVKEWLQSDFSKSGQDSEARPIQTTARGLTATSQRPVQQGLRPVVYEHSSSGTTAGAARQLGAGRYDLARISIGNDAISSVKVPAGWRVTLYQHAGFNGTSKVLTADTPALPDFNDQTSSIVVEGGVHSKRAD